MVRVEGGGGRKGGERGEGGKERGMRSIHTTRLYPTATRVDLINHCK